VNNINSNSNNNSTLPESPDGRRIRRSRTFIDPMSEVLIIDLILNFSLI
jgi:hypothetical protein